MIAQKVNPPWKRSESRKTAQLLKRTSSPLTFNPNIYIFLPMSLLQKITVPFSAAASLVSTLRFCLRTKIGVALLLALLAPSPGCCATHHSSFAGAKHLPAITVYVGSG